MFIGIPSYNRAKILKISLRSFVNSKLVRGFIIVADAISSSEAEEYNRSIKYVKDLGFEVIYDVKIGRRGSTKARNMVLEYARYNLRKDDVLVLYDDDYIYPGDHSLIPAIYWLKDSSIGVVGGRVINIRRRRIDPDFALNIYNLADNLTKITGFIFLNNTHGPRYVDYTTPLMALKAEILDKEVRYDENYGGIGYREESDLQIQIRKLGYKIIFEPRFYTYHLAIESGGNRYSDLENRIFWKWINHIYFMNKWRYPFHKKVLSYMILTTYALINGPSAIKGVLKANRIVK
ncbi:MAG: glycosyltransferase [Desulfurococcales archaeon]|jgi:glycosyltransferase involved in cell wall biosynthesis|nr:glycosyltransferase [Desulfurococcales archaeon]